MHNSTFITPVSQIRSTNELTDSVLRAFDRSCVRTEQKTAKRFDETAKSVDFCDKRKEDQDDYIEKKKIRLIIL